MWKKFKQEIRERFLNFETAKGLYIAPAGAFMMYVSWYHVEDAIRWAGVLIGGYALYEGLRKIIVNRFKQKRAQKKIEDDRASLGE